jgi:hypothetical protein
LDAENVNRSSKKRASETARRWHLKSGLTHPRNPRQIWVLAFGAAMCYKLQIEFFKARRDANTLSWVIVIREVLA